MVLRLFFKRMDAAQAGLCAPGRHLGRGLAQALLTCSLGVAGAVLVASAHAAPQQQSEPAAPATMDEPERQDLSFKLPLGQSIEVDNPYGTVYLRFGGYEHQLDIRATVQQPKGAARFAFAPGPNGQRFVVTATLPDGTSLAKGQRIDLILYVPEAHPIKVTTVAGNIESRGIKADVDFKSQSGNIIARGTEGMTLAETDDGRIQIMLRDGPPAGSYQRLATRTGEIIAGVSDALNADIELSTSGVFATEYSLTVEHLDKEEPNKRAFAKVGQPKAGKEGAQIALDSLRGNIKLWRRTVFVDASDETDGD